MSRTKHVGAGVPLSRLPRFDDQADAPKLTILNVIRVALERADMSHRATGFTSFEIEAAKTWVKAYAPDILQERDALKARVAELERDAARYRWLKLQRWNMWGPNVVSGPRSEHVGNLDAAIDTAMAASKEAPNQTLPQVAGTVPRRARKIGGSYQADGTIVAQFKTLGGADRVVFEFDEPAGMLHIFASEQVELREIES